jgi:DNA-binding NarL/FixJ family response regulator
MAAEILRRIPSARIVLITNHVEADVQRRGLASGALGYVGKFSADVDLVPAGQAALRGELYVSSKR